MKNDLPDGFGTRKCENGLYYEGQWKNGFYHGKGHMEYENNVFTGDFNNGRLHGSGKYLF